MQFFVLLGLLATAYGWETDCGTSRYPDSGIEGGSKIVGGWEARVGEFPYQVSLRNSFGSHFCGGSVINSRWILTAAHCVSGSNANSLRVMAGGHDRQSTTDGQYVQVSRNVVHPDYISALIVDDVALLQTSTALTYGENVRPVCPPGRADYTDETSTVSGWGTTSSGGGSPRNLRYVNVPTLSLPECEAAYPGSIYDGMVCAGELGRDSCQGDSGGPLTFKNADRWEIFGIVSWGRSCADIWPGVYADVPTYLTWINGIIG